MTEDATLDADGGLLPGTVLDDRYTLVRELGRGGFATVYEATQLNMDRRVAIKVLDEPLGSRRDTNFYDRFLREAKVAASIDHPNIVTIHDYGVTPSPRHPYIVMELLEGRDLADVIARSGPMLPARALPLFVSALNALGRGHDAGVIHIDLKPSNLFLERPGERDESLLVVDFGIASLEVDGEDDERLTQTGGFVGTPSYMAPEYINDRLVTPAIDVYQMGLILAELLTGQVVVSGKSTMETLMNHASGKVELPQALLDSPLGPVLRKAVAFEADARYPNANAFAEALAAIDPATVPALTGAAGDMGLSETLDSDELSVPQAREDPAPTVNPLVVFAVLGCIILAAVVLFFVSRAWQPLQRPDVPQDVESGPLEQPTGPPPSSDTSTAEPTGVDGMGP